MTIGEVIWLDSVVDKLGSKHSVEPYEVEEALQSAQFRFVEKGVGEGEDVYLALGRTSGGRYLAVVFIRKLNGSALILSAREMELRERRLYVRK